MKKTDTQDLHTLKAQELDKRAADLRKSITEEMQKRQMTEVKNVRIVKFLRDQLARVLTVKRQQELVQKGA